MVCLCGVEFVHQPCKVVLLNVFADAWEQELGVNIDFTENISAADTGQFEDLR